MKGEKRLSLSYSVGFLDLLLLLFIGLKLGGVISWSWWWVLCPVWLSALGVLLILGSIFFGTLIVAIVSIIIERWKK